MMLATAVRHHMTRILSATWAYPEFLIRGQGFSIANDNRFFYWTLRQSRYHTLCRAHFVLQYTDFSHWGCSRRTLTYGPRKLLRSGTQRSGCFRTVVPEQDPRMEHGRSLGIEKFSYFFDYFKNVYTKFNCN